MIEESIYLFANNVLQRNSTLCTLAMDFISKENNTQVFVNNDAVIDQQNENIDQSINILVDDCSAVNYSLSIDSFSINSTKNSNNGEILNLSVRKDFSNLLSTGKSDSDCFGDRSVVTEHNSVNVNVVGNPNSNSIISKILTIH